MKRTFMLEDDGGIREVVHFTLEAENYHLKSYPTITDFNERDKSIEPDLYLLDLMLPDGSGLDVCNQIKSNQKTPILMMSAHSTLKDLQEYCEANSFLQKPFDINELISQVNSLTEN